MICVWLLSWQVPSCTFLVTKACIIWKIFEILLLEPAKPPGDSSPIHKAIKYIVLGIRKLCRNN
jgi:hypothetical protein